MQKWKVISLKLKNRKRRGILEDASWLLQNVQKKKLIFYEMRRFIHWKGGKVMGRKPKIFSKNPKILLVNMKKYVIIGVDFNVIAVAHLLNFLISSTTLIFSNHCQCSPGVNEEVGPRDQKYLRIPQQPGFEFSGPRL